jgi:hypothetical protein
MRQAWCRPGPPGNSFPWGAAGSGPHRPCQHPAAIGALPQPATGGRGNSPISRGPPATCRSCGEVGSGGVGSPWVGDARTGLAGKDAVTRREAGRRPGGWRLGCKVHRPGKPSDRSGPGQPQQAEEARPDVRVPWRPLISALLNALVMVAIMPATYPPWPARRAGQVGRPWPAQRHTGGRGPSRLAHSFLATSGPVMRASSGKVAAMMPSAARIPPAVRR